MSGKKNLPPETGVMVITHLNIFAQKVAEVVTDYHEMNANPQMSDENKDIFALACMKDIAALSDHLIGLLTECVGTTNVTAKAAPSTDADVIDLQAYKANGGLLN